MTGAVVPCSRPTTCTSWLPDDVSVKATTVAGSGLIALAVAMPRRPMPGCRRGADGLDRHRIAPGLGLGRRARQRGRCRGRRRADDAGARGIPQVGDVDAPAGGRGQPRIELVAGVVGIDLLRRARTRRRRPSTWQRTRARHLRTERSRRRSRALRRPRRSAPAARCRRRCRRRCSRPRGPTSAHRSSWSRAGPAGTCRSPSRPARSARCGTRRSRGRRAARPARGHGSDRCRKRRSATRASAGTTSPRRSWSRSGRSRSPAGCRCSWHPRR